MISGDVGHLIPGTHSSGMYSDVPVHAAALGAQSGLGTSQQCCCRDSCPWVDCGPYGSFPQWIPGCWYLSQSECVGPGRPAGGGPGEGSGRSGQTGISDDGLGPLGPAGV